MATEDCIKAGEAVATNLRDGDPATSRPQALVWGFFTKGPRDPINHRRRATCNYCNTSFSGGKPDVLRKHILRKCQSIPVDIREQYQITEQFLLPTRPENQVKPQKKRQKTEVVGHGPAQSAKGTKVTLNGTQPLTQRTVEVLHQYQLHMFVMCSIPFEAADTPWFREFVHRLQPSFSPAGG